MPQEIKLHKFQKEILTKLTSVSAHRFNDLLIEGLGSEHMNYHLKKLIAFGLVTKVSEQYALTDSGKDYVNSLDDETQEVEKQPKITVIIHGVRKNLNGEIEYLLNRRLEQPYFGKVGRVGGKVRFGETFEEAAKRELYEETGLEAKNLVLEKIYRKMRKREDGKFVQDVVFLIYFVTGFYGTLIEKTKYQDNFWITNKELYSNPEKYDRYDDLVLPERLEPLPFSIEENINFAEGY